MRFSALLLFFCAGLSSGCASALRQPYKPVKESNLKELNAQSLGEIKGGACEYGANPPREFGLGLRETEIVGRKSWLLVVQYRGAGPFGVQGGDSLKLNIDGKAKAFNIAPLDIDKRALGAYILERAAYTSDLETLRQIVSGEKVELTLKGANRSVSLCVPKFSQENFRRWIAEVTGSKVQEKARAGKKKTKK